MNHIAKLSHDLKNSKNIDVTIEGVAKASQNHYLGYFLSNLILEYLTYHEYVSEGQNQKIIEEDASLKKVVSYIQKAMFDSANWLNTAPQSITQKINTLTKYRDSLSEHVAAIAGYDDQLKIHDYVLRRRVLEGNQYPVAKISDEDFASRLLQFIFEFEDAMTINDRIKSVYSQLPVRMSKSKLQEWIESALLGMKGVTVGDLDNYITYLKETYNPEGVPCYGDVLISVHEALGNFDVLYTDIVSNEAVERLETAMGTIKRTLESCVSLYTYTASVLNNMIGLLSVLTEESVDFNREAVDRFIDVMNYIESRKDELMLIDETLVKELDDIAGSFEDQRMTNGQMDGLLEEVKQGHVDDIIRLKMTRTYDRLASLYVLQSSSYFAPLSVEAKASEPVDEKILIDRKNDLLAYVEEVSAEDSRIGKRARIANLLGVMNVIHKNPQEIHRYMLNTLTQCRDEREKNGSKIVLNELMG